MWIRPLLALLALVLLFILISPASPLKVRFNDDAEHDAEVVVAETVDDSADRQKMIDERFEVREGQTLVVNVADADVRVAPGTSNEVHVEVYLEGDDWERAVDYFERQHFSVRQDGGAVLIETDAEHTSWNNWRSHPRISVEIRAPERFNAEVQTSDGDVALERMDGEITLRTSDGDVAAGRLIGPAIAIKTSDGDIRLETATTDELVLQTSDGDIGVTTIDAARVVLHTSDGDIRADRLEARTELSVKTSDGDIRVATARGDAVSLRTSDGSIVTDALVARSATVHVSDGDVHLQQVEGDLEVSGGDSDIHVELAKPGAARLHTGDGDIVLSVPPDVRADVLLRGTDVRVASTFSFSGTVDEHHAEGILNGGGIQLSARASDGTVTLRAN